MQDARANVLIKASAGTGKTYRLSSQYIAALLRGVRPDQILATTFTRKAAGEIAERVLRRLAEAASDDAALAAVAEETGLPDLSAEDVAGKLVEFVRSLHRVRIGTLDAFFARLATAYTLELNLPPGWRMLEDAERTALRTRAVEDVLAAMDKDAAVELVHLLDKGDVKARVLRQVLDAVAGFHDTYHAAGREAAAWSKFPKRKVLPEAGVDAVLAAAETAFETLPKPKGKTKTGRSQVQSSFLTTMRHFENVDGKAFAKSALGGTTLEGEAVYGKKKEPLPEEAQLVLREAADHLGGTSQKWLELQTAATFQLLDRFDAAWSARKREARGLEFGDVKRVLAAGLSGGVDWSYRLDGELVDLLLDEFQDTSPEEWAVLEPIAKRIAASDRGAVFCVGDMKQAIYGWRGGLAEIFGRVQQRLDDVREEQLVKSYRSSPVVIDTVNAVFENLDAQRSDKSDAEHAAVRAFAERFTPHETARTDLSGHATLEVLPFRSREQTDEDRKAKDANRDHVAESIRGLRGRHPARTIGVLTRTNEGVTELAGRLRQLGVDASEEGGQPITDSPAVQLLMSALKLANHPGDTKAAFHVARSPLGSFFADSWSADAASSEQPDDSHGTPGVTDGETSPRLQECRANELPSGAAWTGTPGVNHSDPDALAAASWRIRRQLADAGYGPTIGAWGRALIGVCSPRDANRLRQTVALADDFDAAGGTDADEFLRTLQETKRGDPTASPVRVMTVHQSKGLEFDVVVLAELNTRCHKLDQDRHVVARDADLAVDRVYRYVGKDERRLLSPSIREAFEAAETTATVESLCGFYVAMTRAKRALHLFVEPWEPSKSKPEEGPSLTPASFLHWALVGGGDGAAKPLAAGTTAWTAGALGGDAEWDDDRGDVTTVAEEPVAVRLKPSPPAAETLTPSSLTPPPAASLLGERRALRRGELIHAWLAEIEWLEGGVPGDDRLRRIAYAIGLDAADVAASLRTFRRFTESPAADVLRRPSKAARVFREQPCRVRLPAGVFNGTIDRLLVDGDAATVVDWKSDRVKTPAEEATLVAKYRDQVHAYRAAAAAVLGLPEASVRSLIVLTNEGRAVPV